MYITEKKKFRSERSFSIVLAEEIVRRETIAFLEEKIEFLYFDTKTTSPSKSTLLGTYAQNETSESNERIIEVTTAVADFTDGHTRNKLRVRIVTGEVRLFQIKKDWFCHTLLLTVKEEGKPNQSEMYIYESGVVNKMYYSGAATNPCLKLCLMQWQLNES